MTSTLSNARVDVSRDWTIALGGMVVAVILTQLIYAGFFPGPNGVGHDYAGGMTGYLAEYYWSLSEGPWIPPWFTPAFCGGIPLYADPVNPFFSLPGFLMRFGGINPLASAYITFLVSVGVGFLGAFFFARRRLGASVPAASLAALIFALNGFLASRMMIGHGMYHGVMLIPLIALWLTDGGKATTTMVGRLPAIAMGGVAIAYWVYSGGGVLMVAFALATLLLVSLAWLRVSSIRESLLLGSGASVLALALSASKINAALSYMASFPRSNYLLPGYTGVVETLQVIFAALFTTGANIAAYSQERLTNVQWIQDRHELEYGVTVIPLVLIGLAVATRFLRSDEPPALDAESLMKDHATKFLPRRTLIVVAMVAILALPIALNTYGESWNVFLKSLPVIGSSSALMRWFVVYVPLVAVLGGLAIDRVMPDERRQWILAGLAAAGIAVILGSTDRTFYAQQSYDPKPVIAAFEAAKRDPASRPAIHLIGAFVDSQGRIQLTGNRQDLITQGVSQLACYIPIFGYRLESFPFRTLRPGPIFDIDSEGFNMKNPACFVFPAENNCTVGDHFPVSRRADLERFANYQRFPFEKSARQKAADALSLVTLLLVLGVGVWTLVNTIRTIRAPRS